MFDNEVERALHRLQLPFTQLQFLVHRHQLLVNLLLQQALCRLGRKGGGVLQHRLEKLFQQNVEHQIEAAAVLLLLLVLRLASGPS